MAQDLLDIEIRQKIQAHMRPAGEGLTRNFNIIIDNKIPLGSGEVDIAHAWTSTAATSGCQCEMLATTGIVSSVAGNPVTTDGDGNDCEGNTLDGAVTLVAFYVEVPPTNLREVNVDGFITYPSVRDYTIGRTILEAGGGVGRSILSVPRTPVVDFIGRPKRLRCTFSAIGDSVTVVILASSS